MDVDINNQNRYSRPEIDPSLFTSVEQFKQDHLKQMSRLQQKLLLDVQTQKPDYTSSVINETINRSVFTNQTQSYDKKLKKEMIYFTLGDHKEYSPRHFSVEEEKLEIKFTTPTGNNLVNNQHFQTQNQEPVIPQGQLQISNGQQQDLLFSSAVVQSSEQTQQQQWITQNQPNKLPIQMRQNQCRRCQYIERKSFNKRWSRRNFSNHPGAGNYRCDVGLKSLLRSIREFYQVQISAFLTSERSTSQTQFELAVPVTVDLGNKQHVSYFVRAKMLTKETADLSEDAITLRIRALLLVQNSQSKQTQSDIDQKNFITANRDLDLEQKTKQVSLLMYQLNKDNFHNFVNDGANFFMVNFFAQNNGLALTDPFKQKPGCRAEVLQNLLQLGQYCRQFFF